MLRWRMLAAKYRPLSQFDLILDTERQSSVVKLFFSDFHRKNKRFVIFSGTQLLCLLWLFVNLAAVVLVGLIGLTYNLENSGTFVQTFPGPTSIVDFAYYVPNSVTNPDLVALQRVAYENFFQNLPIDNLTFADFEDKYFSDTYEQSDTAPGFAQYFFVDYSEYHYSRDSPSNLSDHSAPQTPTTSTSTSSPRARSPPRPTAHATRWCPANLASRKT